MVVKKLPALIIVLGPTASGKSDVALALAKKIHGELVSADSRQIYRGMNIGTAKLRTPKNIKQWLVSIVSLDQEFTLQEYQKRAKAVIDDIHRRGRVPIMVGGTGLYIDAVVDNWDIPAVKPNKILRKRLEVKLKRDGLQALVKDLKLRDPASAKKIDLQNPRRVVRALEVITETRQSFVVQQRRGPPLYRTVKIGLAISQRALEQRLRIRAKAIVRRGLVAETKRLLKKYPMSSVALSGIGYGEAKLCIEGSIDKQEMIDRIVRRSMQYTKRQYTWWKRDKNIRWVKNKRHAVALAQKWLKQ